MRTLPLLAAAAAVWTIAAPAVAEPNVPAPPTACVQHNDIYNWTALNDTSVVLENFRHQKVLVKLIGTCYNLKFHETLAISARGESGLSCVQPGDTVLVRDHGFGGGGRCAIVSVAPYTAAAPAHGDGNHAAHGSD